MDKRLRAQTCVDEPSLIRTIPSASDLDRLVRCLATRLVGSSSAPTPTTDRELHPAPKVEYSTASSISRLHRAVNLVNELEIV